MSRRTARTTGRSIGGDVDRGAREEESSLTWTDWRPATPSHARLWLANGALLLWLALLLGLLVRRA